MLRRVCDLFSVGVLLAVITLPLVLTSHAAWDEAAEKRKAAPMPSLSLARLKWTRFAPQFDAYFGDHFGLRKTLLDLRSHIDFFVFGESPSPLVLRGNGDFLFFLGAGSDPTLRNRVLSPADRDHWRQTIEERRAWLADKGIPYVFLIAPDKQTVYREQLPRYLQRETRTISQQIVALMQGSDAESSVVAAAPRLLAAKANGELFRHLDSHWNYYGAYLGYRVALDTLHTLTATGVTGFDFGPKDFAAITEDGGDLATMVGLPLKSNGAQEIQVPILGCLKIDRIPSLENMESVSTGDLVMECASPKTAKKLLIFGDSFTIATIPFFGTTFARTRITLRNSSFADFKRYVEDEHPDFVIEERVERLLTMSP